MRPLINEKKVTTVHIFFVHCSLHGHTLENFTFPAAIDAMKILDLWCSTYTYTNDNCSVITEIEIDEAVTEMLQKWLAAR
ncbi:MAG: hypothetical protein LBI39_02115 [Puniceicoccales bacterium]|nr:hypothetical protein [Puniceicoccales bacterium]